MGEEISRCADAAGEGGEKVFETDRFSSMTASSLLNNLIADLSRGCRGCGFGFGDKFFELAFDVRPFAEHLGGEDAIGVNGEVMRDGVDAEKIAEVMVGVAILDPGHFIFVDEVAPLLIVRVPANTNNDERLAGELFGDPLHVGKLFVTRATPGGPEVDEDDAAAHGIEIELR